MNVLGTVYESLHAQFHNLLCIMYVCVCIITELFYMYIVVFVLFGYTCSNSSILYRRYDEHF